MARSTVLIVEDEPEVAELLEFNLQATGFRTLTAHDGLTACRTIGDQQPDLVLLDLLLPDLTGWEICRMVRGHADPSVAGLPIVMLTALASVEDKLRGLELGADDYISKPFATREVVLKVQNMLARTTQTREVARQLQRLKAGRESQLEFQNLLFHELKNKLVVIRETSSYLGTLAEKVLLLRRVENGVLSLPAEELDLNVLAQAVAGLHRESAEERGIRLRLGGAAPGPVAVGNELAVRVCLSNLVENAVRYSPRDTTVVIRTGGNQERVFLDVDDEGPGIPGSERALLFERFYRGRPAQEVAGTGLGLYIVRTLARAMGGEAILMAVPEGAGTRARISLAHASSPADGLAAGRSPNAPHPVPAAYLAEGGP